MAREAAEEAINEARLREQAEKEEAVKFLADKIKRYDCLKVREGLGHLKGRRRLQRELEDLGSELRFEEAHCRDELGEAPVENDPLGSFRLLRHRARLVSE